MPKLAENFKNIRSRSLPLFVSVFALIGSIVLFQAKAATGGTYYVSPSGSDSAAGTSAAPWKTLNSAIGKLSAGDTLIVKGGAYSGTVSASPNGTAAAPITIKAAAGERPVLTGLVRLTANYTTWDGVNVTWPSSATSGDHMFKMTSGTGWRITNSEIWGAHAYAGLSIHGTAAKWSIDHNYIHDTYASNSTNQDHLIYMNGGTGGGIITRNLFKTSPNGRGVKIGPPSGGTAALGNVTISYNTFYDNTGPSNIQLSYGATGNKIFRNILVKSSQGNITGYNLNGSGNTASDNIGWDSDAVITHSGSSSTIADGGGNKHVDPGLNLTTLKPAAAYADYGRYAPGDTSTAPSPTPTPPPPSPTPDTTAPTVPGAPQAVAKTSSSIGLSWTASTDSVGVTGYNIYRNGSTTPLTKVGAVTSYTDSGLTASTTYSYQLEALDAAGNKSAKSAATSATTPATTATTDVTAPTVSITAPAANATVTGTTNVTATASDNVGVARVEFRIDGTLVKTATASPYSYAWNTTGLVGSHSVDARAVDAAGNAKVATVSVNAGTSTTPAPSASVAQPTGLTTKTVSSVQINLAWKAAATYRVDIYRDGVKVGATTSDSSYGDTYQLKAGTSYKYYIIARDADGNVSQASATVTGTTSGTATGGTTTSTKGSLTGVVSDNTGKPISGAKVSLKVGTTTVAATTNTSGVYLLSNVPADSYPIVYSATGFVTKNDNVTVLAGTLKTKNVTLFK